MNKDRRSNNMQAPNTNGAQGGARASQLSEDIMEAIRELGFVKGELELYLDTHPGCTVAIDYYHKTVDALATLMEQYHQSGNNPLVASGNTNTEAWDWIRAPWPWQREKDVSTDGNGDRR